VIMKSIAKMNIWITKPIAVEN